MAGEGINFPITGDASSFVAATKQAAQALIALAATLRQTSTTSIKGFDDYRTAVRNLTTSNQSSLRSLDQVAADHARNQIRQFDSITQSMYRMMSQGPTSVLEQQQKVVADAGARTRKSMEQATEGLSLFQRGIQALLSGNGIEGLIKKMGALAIAGFSVHKMFQLGAALMTKVLKSYTDLGDGIYRLKLVTGDTTQQTSELLYISNVMGVSSLSLQMRFAQMAKHLVENHKWVKALGIEYRNVDGTVKPTAQTFWEIADSIQAISDSEKREASAMAIFGRGYKDILPVLALTTQQRKAMQEQAKASGNVWDDEQLRRFKEFEIASKQAKLAFQGLAVMVAQQVVPYLATLFNVARDVVTGIVKFTKSSKDAAAAVRVLGLALLFLYSPWLAIGALVTFLVQRFDVVGEIVIKVSEIFGTVVGKGIAVAAKAFQYLLDVVWAFADGFLSIGAFVTGNRFWKFIFGDGASEGIENARQSLNQAKAIVDKAIGGFADNAWEQGGKIGKQLGAGLVAVMKKLKLKKSDLNIGWSEGSGSDPTLDGKAGGGGNKLLEYFQNMVKSARTSLETLVEEAKNARKQMQDTADSVRDSLRNAFNITELAEEAGGGRSGAGLIRLFTRRLEAMRKFVDNVRTLRGMGLPADWLAEIVNAGVDKGAALAKMLVSQPGVLMQLSGLREQMLAETQSAGTMVGEAMYGGRVADLIARSTTYQQQFQSLLVAGRGVGYKPTAEDIAAATQNIANTVYMSVGTNADPYAIEKAIAWALRTGGSMGGGYGGGRSLPGYQGAGLDRPYGNAVFGAPGQGPYPGQSLFGAPVGDRRGLGSWPTAGVGENGLQGANTTVPNGLRGSVDGSSPPIGGGYVTSGGV